MADLVFTGEWQRYPTGSSDKNFQISYPDGTTSQGFAATPSSAGSALCSAGASWHGGSRTTKAFTLSQKGSGYELTYVAG